MIVRTGLAALAAGMSTAAFAGELVIQVTNVASDKGQVGCALYARPDGFPLDPAKAEQKWQPARRGGLTCRFTDIPAGDYAVAVSHDLNGNRVTDRNFIGLPREDWGVTNNIRPRLRAPRFAEARIAVRDGAPVTTTIRLGR